MTHINPDDLFDAGGGDNLTVSCHGGETDHGVISQPDFWEFSDIFDMSQAADTSGYDSGLWPDQQSMTPLFESSGWLGDTDDPSDRSVSLSCNFEEYSAFPIHDDDTHLQVSLSQTVSQNSPTIWVPANVRTYTKKGSRDELERWVANTSNLTNLRMALRDFKGTTKYADISRSLDVPASARLLQSYVRDHAATFGLSTRGACVETKQACRRILEGGGNTRAVTDYLTSQDRARPFSHKRAREIVAEVITGRRRKQSSEVHRK